MSLLLACFMTLTYVALPFVASQISSWQRRSLRRAEVGALHLRMEMPFSAEE